MMTDEQILQKLLEVDQLPEKTVNLPRIGIPIILRGLTGKQVFALRERCTERSERRGAKTDRLDEEQFNVALIFAATVSPNWGDSRLLTKYQGSSGEEVIKRLLLAGELSALGDEVLDLSGFNVSLDEVKN